LNQIFYDQTSYLYTGCCGLAVIEPGALVFPEPFSETMRPTAMSTHIIRAKLMFDKRTYRDIEIPSGESLYDLGRAVVESFDFDFDHAFGFYSSLGRNFYGSPVRYELFADMDDADDWHAADDSPKAKSVQRTRIAEAFTRPKQKMQFVFDYGDEWCFELEARGMGEKVKGTRYPRVLATKGVSPEQYPSEDEDWDDEDWEEE
jgi:hypothetical protein